MTDHAQVLRNYVDAFNSTSNLFGEDKSKLVPFQEFKIAMQNEVMATKAYIESLKEQGYFVPVGLEERNRYQATLYFPDGLIGHQA